MNEDFENRLRRQPPRELPPHWRAEILVAAREGRRGAVPKQKWDASMASLPSLLRQLYSALRTPQFALRWSALAAVWVVILALNHAARDTATIALTKATPPSPEMQLALREQRKLFAELTETAKATSPADRPKFNQPHSQRQTETATV